MIVADNKKIVIIGAISSLLLLLGTTYLSFLFPGVLAPIDKFRYAFCETTIQKVDDAETMGYEAGITFRRDYTENAIDFNELTPYLEQLNPGTILITSHGKSVCALIPGMWKHTMIYLGSHKQVIEYFGEHSEMYRVINKYFITGDEHLIIDASFLHDVAIRCITTMADLQEESTLKVLLCFEPKLSKSENIAYLKNAFKELGKEYDLTFDDYDDKELYCTEFINNCLLPFGISFKQHSDYLNRTITLPNDMVNSIVKDYMDDQISYKLCIRKEADTIKSLGINEVIQFPQDHWMN